MPSMIMYGDMDETNSDTNYGITPSLTSSPSGERFASSVVPPGNHFGPEYDFSQSPFDTIEPSSLQLSHLAHDDSCLLKCPTAYYPQRTLQNAFPTPLFSRTRHPAFPTPYPYPHPLPENNVFPQQQHFNDMFPDEALPDFGFKFGLNHDLRQGHHVSNSEPLIGMNNFNASDLGILSQNPVADDCASVNCSKFSCSSDCCSTQVCQEEACSGKGTPCDDLHCLDNASQPLGDIWAMNQDWQEPIQHEPMQSEMTPDAHNRPCNHTNTEHDVAITLQGLSVPGVPNTPTHQSQQDFSQFERHLLDPADYPAGSARSLTLPLHTHTSLPSTPELDSIATPREEYTADQSGTAQHVCQWLLSGGSGSRSVCGHVCNSTLSLHDHLCVAHLALLNNKTKYNCHWKDCCRRNGQDFASRNKLRRHLATHTAYKPYKCETCREGFSAQQALDQHVRTHTGETPYKCDFEGCNKAFKQKSALTMHKRTHTGERPLVCEVCGKRFCESSNLSKHRKTHSPEYKFECKESGCGKKFNRIDQLRRHEAVHQRPKKKRKFRVGVDQASSPPDSTPETSQDQQQQRTEIQV